jgi:hopanoid biosynthesis associated protein HpnK
MKCLLVTGDDFGRSTKINEAIDEYHAAGALTQASLMVNETAVDEAARIARRNPELCVGLHLTFCDGPAAHISALTDRRGNLRSSPAAAGLQIAFSKAAQAALEGEIERQFSAFLALGFPATYWDGHHHLHLHPEVLRATLPIAAHYGFKVTRVVREPFPWRPLPAIFHLLSRAAIPLLDEQKVHYADRVFGLTGTGKLDERRIGKILRRLGNGVNELYLHPGAELSLPRPERLAAMIYESGAQKRNSPIVYRTGSGDESTPAHSSVSAGASSTAVAEGADSTAGAT